MSNSICNATKHFKISMQVNISKIFQERLADQSTKVFLGY